MALVPREIIELERKNSIISGVSTTVIMLLLALFAFFFTAYRTPSRPPGKEYKLVGAIDFGDNRQGSKQVNTLDRSVPDPSPTPPAQSRPQPTPNPVKPAATPPKPVTTPAPKPVTTPASTPAKPAPQTTTPTQPAAQPAQPTQQVDEAFTFSNTSGGANQGNAEPGSVGNSGTPSTNNLDPRGMYSFGEGVGGGAGERMPVSVPYPVYNSQEEGAIKYEFFIEPDGTVSYVRALPNNKPELAKLGEEAIRKWKFTPQPGTARQRARVTITFRLRG